MGKEVMDIGVITCTNVPDKWQHSNDTKNDEILQERDETTPNQYDNHHHNQESKDGINSWFF